jgi:hypothetical protein
MGSNRKIAIQWLKDYFLLYRAYSYIHSINQQMRSVKYSSWQVSNSYMFQRRSAILREFAWTKNSKSSTPVPVPIAHTGIIKILNL